MQTKEEIKEMIKKINDIDKLVILYHNQLSLLYECYVELMYEENDMFQKQMKKKKNNC